MREAVGISLDLDLMRASALLESDPAAAARMASVMLKREPASEEARLLLATACQRMGDATTARAQLESLVRAQPDSPLLLLELARAEAAAGRHAEAVAALQSAVTLDARLAEGWRELAAQQFARGDTAAGDAAYDQYARLVLFPAELNDAAAAINDKRFDAALAMLDQRLRQAPDDVIALRMVASIASAQGDYIDTEKYLTKCLQLAPGYAAARFDLATELYAQQRHQELLPETERLLRISPANTAYLGLKAQALRLYGRIPDALALVRQAIAHNPDDGKLRLLLGHLLRESGEQSEAIAAYRQALAVQPGMGEAYWSLADLKTVAFTSADREAMQVLAARGGRMGSSRTSVEFALGKALEDEGQYAAAFEHYARGNSLHRSTLYYDQGIMSTIAQRSVALYQPGFFAARAGWGSADIEPIFIVGVPRSGSTLLEQILASHSQVEGTRELPDIPAIARDLVFGRNAGKDTDYPLPVAKLERADVDGYAARYLHMTSDHRRLGRPRFVDKMLGNFAHLGLVHLMFPRATIIDARRHPMACCFSCYKQLFARGLAFTYDLGELGQYYRDYYALMEHMDAVLPGRVHRVHYEQLVADPERVVTRLLEACGLPFEEGCLKFYENRRVVNTVSSEQVRRPITADAVDHWRRFEPWLGELRVSLGDLVEKYPGFKPVAESAPD